MDRRHAEYHLYLCGVRVLCPGSSPPQNLFCRRNLEALGTFSLPFSLSMDLEPIEASVDAGLTDRPLRLVASMFWFLCAVFLLEGGAIWVRFSGVSSSTSTVVSLLSDSRKAVDSALAWAGGAGSRGVRSSSLDVCEEHLVEWG